MVNRIAWVLAVGIMPATAAAQQPSHRFYETSRILLPECVDGYLDACEELTRIAVGSIRTEEAPRSQWRWAKLLLRACNANYDPACSALVRVGERFAAEGQRDGLNRGRRLLVRICQIRPEIGCAAAFSLAQELSVRPAKSDLGIDMLEEVCVAGEHVACQNLLAKSLPNPYGARQRTIGRIIAYSGLGVALASSVAWAVSFSEDRCGTRSNRNDGRLLYASCTIAYVGYLAGTAASFVGTKSSLNGQARGRASDADVSGTSIFLWVGLGLGSLGAALPASIELLRKDWREGIAWSPLVFGAAAQAFFFLARWLGPSVDGAGDEARTKITPALLPVQDRSGGVASAIGAQFVF